MDHLSRIFRVLESLDRLPIAADKSMLQSTAYFIRNLSPRHKMHDSQQRAEPDTMHDRSGELKEQGRAPAFGFLRDTFGVDTYVNRNSVSATLWKDMCTGRTVRYDICSDGERTWAERVSLL